MQLNREEVGKRLEQFAMSRFVLLKDFAKEIGIASSNLKTHYFTGKNLPGAEMISRLMSMGCNINWLFHGDYHPAPKEVTIEHKVKNLEAKVEKLEKENDLLRDSLAQISSILKSTKKKPGKVKGAYIQVNGEQE